MVLSLLYGRVYSPTKQLMRINIQNMDDAIFSKTEIEFIQNNESGRQLVVDCLNDFCDRYCAE